ncbi:MAG: ferritin-like domain-containing protein [Thermoproteota archaeon]|nr:ferritin-like domain-containing protein [Thermoproteota archaeon]
MSTTNSITPEIKDKVVEHLNEMLSAENAAVDRLDSRIQECLLPEGKQQLQHHQDETRQHQERLRQIIVDLGGSPTDSKAELPTLRLPTGMLAKKTLTDMAKSITGGGGGDTNPMREELELMHTKEDYGIEHVEIIAYRTLTHLCERLGIKNAIPLLKQSMQEEESMANWIETNMPMTLDKIWPRIEAALTGRSKEQTSPTSEKTATM